MPEYRSETDILNDLEKLCTSSGYVHALAFLCWQSNFIGYDKELTGEDLSEMKSPERLIRSELSLLTGLMIKSPISLSRPTGAAIQEYIERSEGLLAELHSAMSFGIMASAQETNFDSDVLFRGASLREPFFYSGEAAYIFQYRDFASRRYFNDANWLTKNKGFSLDDVRKTINSINELQTKKLFEIREHFTEENISELSLLPAFTFTDSELLERTDCSIETINNICLSFSPKSIPGNTTLKEIGSFNEANSYPVIPISKGKYIILQSYSLAESAYESPFYWMLQDNDYSEKAKENRGIFTENFSAERLREVLGSHRVFENVLILDGKGQRLGEIDVLVIYADRAIILQAKSKKLTEAARKGNDEAIRSDFKMAIQDAYNQGFKCASLLTNPARRLADSKGREIQVRQDLSEIFIFCVVSDYYPALSYQADRFLELQNHKIIRRPYVMDVFF